MTEAELLQALLYRPGAPTRRSARPRLKRARPRSDARSASCVAEDYVINQKVVTRILEKQGHRAFVVSDGRAALAALEAETFDLVLMDVQMPELDGLATTEAIRAREAAIRDGVAAAPPGSAYADPVRPGGGFPSSPSPRTR